MFSNEHRDRSNNFGVSEQQHRSRQNSPHNSDQLIQTPVKLNSINISPNGYEQQRQPKKRFSFGNLLSKDNSQTNATLTNSIPTNSIQNNSIQNNSIQNNSISTSANLTTNDNNDNFFE